MQYDMPRFCILPQDVSRLVDICRQSIVFDSLDDVAQCLETIAADPEVCVVRVKNRLHQAYDASASGGYRDVAVNLRISCKTSIELGVSGHIGEVQLILRQFAEIKVPRTARFCCVFLFHALDVVENMVIDC